MTIPITVLANESLVNQILEFFFQSRTLSSIG